MFDTTARIDEICRDDLAPSAASRHNARVDVEWGYETGIAVRAALEAMLDAAPFSAATENEMRERIIEMMQDVCPNGSMDAQAFWAALSESSPTPANP